MGWKYTRSLYARPSLGNIGRFFTATHSDQKHVASSFNANRANYNTGKWANVCGHYDPSTTRRRQTDQPTVTITITVVHDM
jgi:hypothetical protein